MRKIVFLIPLISLALSSLSQENKHLLIYTHNGPGFVHKNIEVSVDALKKIADGQGWTYQVTDDPAIFTDTQLKQIDAIIFSNTNNAAFLTQDQRMAFQEYIRGGGRFVGIHSACGSEREWPWFWAMLGGKFVRHPMLQPFDVIITDPDHPSTQNLPQIWKWEDECYFMDHLNPDIHVLLSVDLKTIDDDQKIVFPGAIFGDLFPLAWCHQFDGGKQWFTALGHKPEHYSDHNFIEHLKGGLIWVLDK